MNNDVMAQVDTMAARAVDAYYQDRRASVMPFYLYYRTGALRFLADGEESIGWTLADPQAHRGHLSRNQLFNVVRERARRLPILAEEG
jgi:hypothetical protein